MSTKEKTVDFLTCMLVFVVQRIIELLWWGFIIMTGVVAANYFLGYRFLEVL